MSIDDFPVGIKPIYLLVLFVVDIFAKKICNQPYSEAENKKMSTYILRHQLEDGSFGLHQESKVGTVFCSILNYLALRFLGHNKNEVKLKKCLDWIHENGGPLYSANWCKFIV